MIENKAVFLAAVGIVVLSGLRLGWSPSAANPTLGGGAAAAGAAAADSTSGEPRPGRGPADPARTSPRKLLDGIYAARARGDATWLARAMVETAGSEQPSGAVLRDAWRTFLWHEAAPLWERIERADRRAAARFVATGDHAVADIDTGGALGGVRLEFRAVDGVWYWSR